MGSGRFLTCQSQTLSYMNHILRSFGLSSPTLNSTSSVLDIHGIDRPHTEGIDTAATSVPNANENTKSIGSIAASTSSSNAPNLKPTLDICIQAIVKLNNKKIANELPFLGNRPNYRMTVSAIDIMRECTFQEDNDRTQASVYARSVFTVIQLDYV